MRSRRIQGGVGEPPIFTNTPPDGLPIPIPKRPGSDIVEPSGKRVRTDAVAPAQSAVAPVVPAASEGVPRLTEGVGALSLSSGVGGRR